MQTGPVNGYLSPQGPRWGTLRLFVCRDFWEKIKFSLGSFFLDPEDIKILSLGAIWNFSKEQGSTEMISDYGA